MSGTYAVDYTGDLCRGPMSGTYVGDLCRGPMPGYPCMGTYVWIPLDGADVGDLCRGSRDETMATFAEMSGILVIE